MSIEKKANRIIEIRSRLDTSKYNLLKWIGNLKVISIICVKLLVVLVWYSMYKVIWLL